MDIIKLKFAVMAMAATLTLTTATVTAVNPASYAETNTPAPMRLAAAHDMQAARAIGLAF